jgi:UDP-N-acetylmuramate--alanine ligase
VRRRFEYTGRSAGVAVYDDYAHHPTEVAAQLRAAREVTDRRLLVAFQPHLYSRTQAFQREFGAALALADEVVVLDVYGAREEPVPGVSGALVAGAVPLPSARVHYVPRWAEVPEVVAGLAEAGDLVVTMGAGDVTVLGPEVLAELGRRFAGSDGSAGFEGSDGSDGSDGSVGSDGSAGSEGPVRVAGTEPGAEPAPGEVRPEPTA